MKKVLFRILFFASLLLFTGLFTENVFASCEGPGYYPTHSDYSCNYEDGYSYNTWCCDNYSPYGSWWKYCTYGSSGGKCLEQPSVSTPSPGGVISTTPVCSVSINQIVLERDGADPSSFCLGDTIMVGADVSVAGADPSVKLDFYFDNTWVETKYVNIPYGSSSRVTFDRRIYTNNIGVTDPTVKIVASASSCTGDVKTKFFSVRSCAPTTTPTYPTYGTLSVKVTDCSTGYALNGATVDARSTAVDPISYSDSNGYVTFSLNSGTYTTTVSYPNYYSKSQTSYVYSGQTTTTNICLSRIQTVYPTCQISLASSSISKTSITVGDSFDVFIKLKMAFQAIDPSASVTVYAERVYGDPSQTKTFYFPYSGSIDEKTFTFYTSGWQTGSYNIYVDAVGSGTCGSMSKTYLGSVYIGAVQYYPPTACTPQYLSSYQCSGNWKQQLYQYSNCNTNWLNIEYCSYGCSSGYCLSYTPTYYAPSGCTQQYLSSYQCSGNWKQQLYQYSNCNTNWLNIEYCSYGCSGSYCLSAPTVQYPPVAVAGNDQTVYDGTSVTLSSSGSYDSDGYITSYAWKEGSDLLSSSTSFSRVFSVGTHTITLTVTDNSGNTNSDSVIVTVLSRAYTEQYLNNYQCYGNSRQQLYQYSSGATEWRNIEYCRYGCSNGYCLSVYIPSSVVIRDVDYPPSGRQVGGAVVSSISTARDVSPKVETVERVQSWSETNVSTSSAPTVFLFILLVVGGIGLLAYGLSTGGVRGRNAPEGFQKRFFSIISKVRERRDCMRGWFRSSKGRSVPESF